MTLSEWKIPLFKRRTIEPKELIQAVWQLGPMEPSGPSSSPAEENNASGELVVHLGHLHVLLSDHPRIGLAVPQEQMAPPSRPYDVLVVTIALSVLLISAILAVS